MFGRKKRVSEVGDAVAPEAADASEGGPHDRSDVADVREFYTGLGSGYLDLGSLVIGVPKGSDLNVALDPNGLPEFHVVSTVSRVVPRVFAAPKSAGLWRELLNSMRDQLDGQNADTSVEEGPWGRELVAEMSGAVFRAIGVDGRRWTAEVRVMATPENAAQAAEEGREVFRRLLVDRGDDPMPVREPLPLTIPDEIQQGLTKARSQMAAQQQARAYQQQMAAGGAAGGAAAPTAQQPAQQQAPQQQHAQQQAPPQQQPTDGPGEQPRRQGSAMDRLRGDDGL